MAASAARSPDGLPHGVDGETPPGSAARNGPINRLVPKPTTATPIRAAAEIHQWPPPSARSVHRAFRRRDAADDDCRHGGQADQAVGRGNPVAHTISGMLLIFAGLNSPAWAPINAKTANIK